MAITGADLFFVGSTSVDGGDMGTAIVQDAVENNVFPDVMPADRVSGIAQYRQVYATVLSNDNDALSSAQVGLLARPTDANVETWVVKAEFGDTPNFIAGLALYEQAAIDGTVARTATATSGSSVYTGMTDTSVFTVGDRVKVDRDTSTDFEWRIITAKTSDSVTISGSTTSTSGPATIIAYKRNQFSDVRPLSGLALTTAGASAGATTLTLDRLDVRAVTPAIAAGYNVNTSLLGATGGRQPLFFKNDRVLVQHPSTPATREFATILHVNHSNGVVTFTAGLVNAYPTGSKITLPVDIGTLQASVSVAPFSLQTWNRAWSNTASGGAISSRYLGLPNLVNEGAVNDRWVCVFTSTTQFTLTSERLGQIASGNTGTNFSPLNPVTNEPYFTLLATSWGDGWLPGNAIRFNTRAAAAPVWVARVVAPSSPGGTDSATMFIRGDVNA